MISVCIRAHDRPAGLKNAVESVLAQTYSDFEVVVSDDTGSCEDVVRAFPDHRVRYHLATGATGPAANLRSAFNAANGSYLALLDDDDRWHPEFLERAIAPFEREPDIGVVFTDFNLVVGDRRMRRGLKIAAGRHDTLLQEILAGSPVLPSAAVLRRAVWEEGEAELPLVDHALGARTVWIRAAAAGWPFFYIDEALIDYALHAGQEVWRESAPAKNIALLERFRFTGTCESLRRDSLAHARMTQAAFDLRAGRLRSAASATRVARADLGGHLSAGHWLALTGLRSSVVRSTLRHPRLLALLRTGWLRAGTLLSSSRGQ